MEENNNDKKHWGMFIRRTVRKVRAFVSQSILINPGFVCFIQKISVARQRAVFGETRVIIRRLWSREKLKYEYVRDSIAVEQFGTEQTSSIRNSNH